MMLQLGTAFRQARFISRNLPQIHPHVVVIIHGMGTRRTEKTETDHIQFQLVMNMTHLTVVQDSLGHRRTLGARTARHLFA